MLERTFLYGLALVGVGTAKVESLRSFLLRLAFAHNVKPRMLIEMLLVRHPLDGQSFDVSELLKMWDIHSGGDVAEKVRGRLELATGADLLPGTLTPFNHLLAGQHLVKRGIGRYCPVCVKEHGAYGHLLWEVACVSACPVHGVRLREASICGAPKQEHLKVNARPRLSHVCSTCGSIGFACITGEPLPATEDEVWVATQVGRLLSAGLETARSWTRERFLLGLHQLVNGWYHGSVVKASLSAGLSRGSVCTWSAGVFKPSLAGLMQLCHHAQVDIGGLFSGRCEPASTYDDTAELVNIPDGPSGAAHEADPPATSERVQTVRASAQARTSLDLLGRSYVLRECSLSDIKTTLENALTEVPPPNLTKVAARLGTSARFMLEKWPKQTKALAEAGNCYRKEQEQTKFERAVDIYGHAAVELVDKGKPVTPKYLQKASGLVAFSQNETRVRALDMVVNRFRPTASAA